MTHRLFYRELLGCLAIVATLVASATAAPIEIATVQHDGEVDFEKEILPILRRNCLACHNSTEAESDLVLETPQSILKGGAIGPAAIAGNSGESFLLQVASHQEDPVMPPEDNDVGAKNLSPQELGLIKLWIEQGAKGEVLGAAGPVAWQPLPPGVNPVYAVAVSPDGQFVAAGRANQIFLYHVPSKRELGRLTDPNLVAGGVYDKPGVAHLDLVQSLAFSPSGNLLASGGYRNVKLWQRGVNVRKAELTGIAGTAKSAATSADGKWLAVGQEDGKIQLFDLVAGKAARTLEGHGGPVTGVCFSADAAKLYSGSADKTYRVWNPADGKPLDSVETPAPIGAIALLDDGKLLATGGEDHVIRTWALDGDKPEDGVKPIKELKGHSGPITALAVFPNAATQLLSGSKDATVRHWDANGGNQIRQVAHGAPVQSVAIRVDGQRYASAGGNASARLWNAANGQQVAELKGDFRKRLDVDEANRAVTLAKRMVDLLKKDLEAANKRKTSEEENGKKAEEALKTADEDFKKKSEAAKMPLAEKAAAEKRIEEAQAALDKAQEAKTAAEKAVTDAGDDDAKKKAAEEQKKQADQEFAKAEADFKKIESDEKKKIDAAQKPIDEMNAAQRVLEAARRSVERAKQSIQKAADVIPLVEQQVKSAEQSQQHHEQALADVQKQAGESEQTLAAVAFSPDGSTLAAAGESQTVYTWDSETGAPIDTFAGQGAAIGHVAFDADNDIVAIAANQTAIVWDADPDWQLDRMIGSPDNSDAFVDRVTSLAFSHDGKWLASGGGEPSRSGELKIWNTENGTLVREIPDAHSDTVFAIEFSRDDQHIASCAADRFMKTFDAATGDLIRSFEGHTHHVLGVSWSADGRTLASSGADKVVKVWNFLTGDQQRTISGFNKEVTAVRFVSDTTNVIASCGDKNVYLKRVDNGGNVRTFGGSQDFVYSVDASADGKTIVAGGQDSVVRIWSDNGQVIANFEPPQQEQTASAN